MKSTKTARKSIFEILEDKYDFRQEFKKITYLFKSNIVHFGGYGYQIEWFVDKFFSDWEARGSCINCADMRKELGIDAIIKLEDPSLEDIILCLEYYVNIVFFFIKKCCRNQDKLDVNKDLLILNKNINILVEHLNLTKHVIAKEEKVILLPNNPAATAVSETAPTEIAFAVLKYNHASLKGQTEEKRKLLQSIANEYEDLLDNPTNGFGEYFKTTRGLLNNLNIRHNNKSGKNKNDLVQKMSKEELEKQYDELYRLLLFCILTKENVERKKAADELLKQIKC